MEPNYRSEVPVRQVISEGTRGSGFCCPSCGEGLKSDFNRLLRPCCEKCAPIDWLLAAPGGSNNSHMHRAGVRASISFIDDFSRGSALREARRQSGLNYIVIAVYCVSDSLACFEFDLRLSNFDLGDGSRLEGIWLRQREWMLSQLRDKERTKIRRHFGPQYLRFTALLEAAEGWKTILRTHLGDGFTLKYAGPSPCGSLINQAGANLIQ
jgi:hypothetical protein